MPFGCMPGTIVAGVMQAVKRERNIPFINMVYDGAESSGNDIQLEAFMEQAKARAEGCERRNKRHKKAR